ncbi:hypothetical protein ACL02T_24280 [Pseudonocardia sp. RS010]|uniref:hypothetical protein n=1 Tax=Pseudonocardia sp. RS010 TaxID=3385979 RepID=UPI0039A0513E
MILGGPWHPVNPPSGRVGPVRAVLATPLPEDLCRLVEEREPRLALVRDHGLLPPVRWPSDHTGDPAWRRSPDRQRRFEDLLDSADARYGLPGEHDAAALARTVAANPRLRWAQTRAAGGGATVRAAGLSEAQRERVVFTTTAGVHGGPPAERWTGSPRSRSTRPARCGTWRTY